MRKRLFIILYMIGLVLSVGAQPHYIIRQLGYEQGLSNNYVKDITQDKMGFLWFATEEGLNRYDGYSFRNYLKGSDQTLDISGNELNCVQDDPESPCLWIGTQSAGLNCYDYLHNTFKVYRHTASSSSLSCDYITCIRPVRGGLWIGTYNGGVDYFDKKTQSFRHYNTRTVPGFPGNQIWEVADDGKGHLYIGHQDHGLTVLDLRTKRCVNYQPSASPNSLPGRIVRSLCIDGRGQVWLATDQGLAMFNPATKMFRRFPEISQNCYQVRFVNRDEVWTTPEFGGILSVNTSTYDVKDVRTPYIQGLYNNWLTPSEQSLRSIFVDCYKNIWLGTWGHGIFMWEHVSPLFQHYLFSATPSDYFLENPSVMSVTTDTVDNLWMGTDGGGINVFTGDKRTAVYTQGKGRKDNCMQAALRDSKGNLWFGTYYAGLLCFPAGSRQPVQVYTPAEKPATDVRALYEDAAAGTIWVATSTGVDLFQRDTRRRIRHLDLPDNLVRTIIPDGKGYWWAGTFNGGLYILTPDGKVRRVFSKKEGFLSNTVNQVFRDRQGHMWVGTSEGLVLFRNADFTKPCLIYGKENGLDNSYIRAIAQDRRQRIWVSTNRSICCLRPNNRFLCYSQVEGKPLGNFTDRSAAVTREGDLCFGSVNGLYRFNPDELLKRQQLPTTVITGLSVFQSVRKEEQSEENVFFREGKDVSLDYDQNTVNISFSIRDFAFTNRVAYTYRLEGLDDNWTGTKGMRTITFRDLPPGSYTFVVKAHIPNQTSYSREARLSFTINPPFYAAWWAKTIYVLLIAGCVWWLLRFYKKRVHLEYLYASEKKNYQKQQELNKERLQFYTNITHELRTPLTLIIGPIEDVEKSRSLTPKDRHTVGLIHRNALRLLSLINELLEFRKTETGNRQLRVVRGDIVRTIRETGLKYMELLRNPSVKFLLELPSAPVEMYYDPEVLTIIIDNLISNAIKYTREGSITLKAETEDDRINIHVKDTGYGISPDAIKHIFERYYQEESDHQASGTGIGLSLVKNLVRLHHGHISVASEPGEGSCFTLSLSLSATYPDAIHGQAPQPVAIASAVPEDGEPEEEEKDNEAASAGKPVVLVVEDNPDISAYIASTLTDSFDIHTAENGREGLETALEIIPDIVVCDILMPEMNGYEMCRRLKTDVRTSHIPVIMLTAKNSMEDKIEGYESGADSYITKPFSTTLLKSRIENIIAQRKALFSPIMPVLKVGQKAMEEKRETIKTSLSEIDHEFIGKVDDYILSHLTSDKLDISGLSEELCMSRSTLYRKIKSLTGLSSKEYISRKRMQRAEELLVSGKYTVGEVADAVGIDNKVYFRQCFKKEFGIAPNDYLTRLKKGNDPHFN